MVIKNCVICGEAFEARRSAKTCGSEHSRELRFQLAKKRDLENPEKRRLRQRRWKMKNSEKRREYPRRRRVENPEKHQEQARRQRTKNPKRREYDRQNQRQRRADRPEDVLESNRRWRRKAKDLMTLSNLLAMQAGFTVEKHHV